MRKLFILMALLAASGLMARAQQLTIISPNGGETLVSGTPLLISWSYAGLTGEETLLIALEGADDFGPIAYGKVADGAYEWPAGRKMDGSFAKPAGDYRILIELVENDMAYDTSDAPFSLVPPASVVSLLTPNGGESLGMGSACNINWSCAGQEGFVSLTLLQDDRPLGAIAENLPAAGLRYRWRVGSPLGNGAAYGAGGGYRIRVQWHARPVMSTGKGGTDSGGARDPAAGLAAKNSDSSDNVFQILLNRNEREE